MSAPKRIQRQRTAGWRMPTGAIYVGRPGKWGNPFRFHDESTGLVRYQPATPNVVDFEGRISANGMRHDYYGADGTVTEFWVRWATHAELVELFRRTLLDPTPGMVGAWPSRGGRFTRYTAEDVRRHLAGRDLACWCPLDVECHADVLLSLANPTREDQA